jgi:predicted alternative tryptophan synthase beta-subunit
MKALSKITGNVINGKIAEILCRLGKATEIKEEQIDEVVEAKEESINVDEIQEVNKTEIENVEEITEEPVIEQHETAEEVINVPESVEIPKKKQGRPVKK